MVDVLWGWCRGDATCREAYHQSESAPNRTVFRHLLPPHIGAAASAPGADVYAALRSALCSKAPADLNRELWLMKLLAFRGSQAPLCDVNHELRFDAQTLHSECVCRADRECDDAIYDRAPYHILLAFITLAAVVHIGGTMYKNSVLIRALDTVTGEGAAGTAALLRAMT
jgi:hypothetical protein